MFNASSILSVPGVAASLGEVTSLVGAESIAPQLAAQVLSEPPVSPHPSVDASLFYAPSRIPRTSLFAPSEIVRQKVAETLRRSRELIAKREEIVDVEWRSSWDGDPVINAVFRGVPPFAKLVIVGVETKREPSDPPDTRFVSPMQDFRHFTRDGETLREIVESQMLFPGPTPFINNGVYVDLVGAFVAAPHFLPEEVGAEEVGVDDSRYFVDLRFYPGTGLIYLLARPPYGRYLMIPGIPRHHDAVHAKYAKWVELGEPTRERCDEMATAAWERYVKSSRQDEEARREYVFWSHMGNDLDWYVKIKSQGGFPEPSPIPVRIIRTGFLPKPR